MEVKCGFVPASSVRSPSKSITDAAKGNGWNHKLSVAKYIDVLLLVYKPDRNSEIARKPSEGL